MMRRKTTNSNYYLLFCFLIFITMSCSGTPQDKPNLNADAQPDVSSNDTGEERISYAVAAMNIQHLRSLNHITLIEFSCSYYHDAFGRMPENMTELLDSGFMLIWPGNTYQKGLVKLLESPPDASNPDDLGNIHYKRYNDHEASIFYLSLDRKESTETTRVYKTVEMNINSATAAYTLHPDDSATNPYVIIGYEMKDFSKDELFNYGYRKNLSQTLSILVNDALKRTGQMDDSFGNMLIGGCYHMSKSGHDFLINRTNNNKIVFDIGKCADGIHVFHACCDPDDSMKYECRRFDDVVGDYGEIKYRLDCPDSAKTSIFSSMNLNDIVIPEEGYLNVEDL